MRSKPPYHFNQALAARWPCAEMAFNTNRSPAKPEAEFALTLPPSDLPICVDGRMLRDRGTGVSTYARSLIDALEAASARPHLLSASHEDDSRLVRWLAAVAGQPQMVHRAQGGEREGRELVGRDIFRRAHVHFGLHQRPLTLRSAPPYGIMHWTYPVPLVMDGWVNLYTVHDAIPLIRPDLTPISAHRHRKVLDALLAHAHRLITVSDAARDEIVAALGCDPDLVVNCGQPADIGPRSVAISQRFPHKGYLLYCGSIEPRKNLTALLAAYRASGSAMPLVIAGPEGWRAESILRDIDATPGAVRLSYLARDELLGLLEHARALVFPSLAEGFGLPVIEAMALGAAVLTSSVGALAEVAGGAALLVDPADHRALAAGTARIVADDELVGRLAALGHERARAFSQDAFIGRLSAVYGSAFDGRAFRDNQPVSVS